MDYIELNITVPNNDEAEIITALLSDFPFESFASEGTTLKAYIPAEKLADCKPDVDALLAERGIARPHYITIESQDWNTLWEKQFDPVEVEGTIRIRAPFHEADPRFPIEVVIMPKMAFGTGHHATTRLMCAALAETDLQRRHLLDMGSGTGVLAIAAVKMGAASVDAIDIDEWAWHNCSENIEANGVADRIHSLLGDANAIPDKKYHAILANINRNILLADMPRYVHALQTEGLLFLSGFLEQDIPQLSERAEELGLTPAGRKNEGEWALLIYRKKA